MKKARKVMIPAVVLSLGILAGCSVISSGSSSPVGGKTMEASISLPFSSNTGSSRKHDATAFLVGEFFVSNGNTAFFDGRGALTVVAPDGSSVAGYYSMQERDDKKASVTINFGEGDVDYAFELISSDGGFTLTDPDNNLLVFVLRSYD